MASTVFRTKQKKTYKRHLNGKVGGALAFLCPIMFPITHDFSSPFKESQLIAARQRRLRLNRDLKTR